MAASTTHVKFVLRSSGAFKSAENAASTLETFRRLFKDSPAVLAAIDADIFGRTTEELRQLGTACHLQKKRAAAKVINVFQKIIPVPVVPVPVLPDPATHAGADDIPMMLNEPWDVYSLDGYCGMEHSMDIADDADVMHELIQFLCE